MTNTDPNLDPNNAPTDRPNIVHVVWSEDAGDLLQMPVVFTTEQKAKDFVLMQVANYFLEEIKWHKEERYSNTEYADIHTDTWYCRKTKIIN